MSAGHVWWYTWFRYCVSGAADVLWMSVVRGMRGVGRVCEMYFGCGGVDGVGGEWVGGLDQGLEG